MPIDPRHLTALLAIKTHGSFVRAAEALNMSQPALSSAIATLESRLGSQLIERGPKGATLNQHGERLATHAENIKATLGLAEEEARLHRAGLGGRLLVGGTPIALTMIAAPVLAQMASGHAVRADAVEGSDDQLMDMLQHGRIEIFVGTVGVDGDAPDVTEIVLAQVSFCVFVRSGHPWATRPSVAIADLAEWQGQWVLPAPGSGFRRHVESAFVAAGLSFPANAISCHTLSVHKELLLNMDCVTLLPPAAAQAEIDAGLVVPIPLTSDVFTRSIGLKHLSRATLSPLAQRFIELAQRS